MQAHLDKLAGHEASAKKTTPALGDGSAPVARGGATVAGMSALDRIINAPFEGSHLHDGNAAHGLGAGDEVFDTNGEVRQAFSASASGVVAAALYELHRGDRRPLAMVLADNSAGRVARGPDAAVEAHGNNRDASTASHIGTLPGKQPHAVGPIGAYKAAAKLAGQTAWCGAFLSFVYQRCGIHIGDLAWSLSLPSRLAGDSSGRFAAAYHQLSGKQRRGRFGGELGRGVMDASQSQTDAKPTWEGQHVASVADLDIRPGDCFWEQHSKGEGHTGLIVGVHRGERDITLVTVEGNFSNKLSSRVLRISVDAQGKIDSAIKGWGRPAELAQEQAPKVDGAMPEWIADAKSHGTKHEDTRLATR